MYGYVQGVLLGKTEILCVSSSFLVFWLKYSNLCGSDFDMHVLMFWFGCNVICEGWQLYHFVMSCIVPMNCLFQYLYINIPHFLKLANFFSLKLSHIIIIITSSVSEIHYTWRFKLPFMDQWCKIFSDILISFLGFLCPYYWIHFLWFQILKSGNLQRVVVVVGLTTIVVVVVVGLTSINMGLVQCTVCFVQFWDY